MLKKQKNKKEHKLPEKHSLLFNTQSHHVTQKFINCIKFLNTLQGCERIAVTELWTGLMCFHIFIACYGSMLKHIVKVLQLCKSISKRKTA